jgi:hypothetical protein
MSNDRRQIVEALTEERAGLVCMPALLCACVWRVFDCGVAHCARYVLCVVCCVGSAVCTTLGLAAAVTVNGRVGVMWCSYLLLSVRSVEPYVFTATQIDGCQPAAGEEKPCPKGNTPPIHSTPVVTPFLTVLRCVLCYVRRGFTTWRRTRAS